MSQPPKNALSAVPTSPADQRQPLSGDTTTTTWQRVKFALRAIEVRLRFIGVFVVIGLSMAYWTTIEAYWDRWTRPDSVELVAEEGVEYYCPMHPSVVRSSLEPNGAVPNCPICGMPLSKRKIGAQAELPAGVLSRVQLSPERVHMAGVKTVAASYMPLMKQVRTVGYVQYDEARQSEIVSRVGGYLERLLVDKTYVQVESGQPLAEIYSPDLYSGVQELLLAKKHGAGDLIAAARQRLKLLGVDDAEIDDALQTGADGARLLIRSPQSGQVIEKNIVEGASVEPGTVLFRVADLSTVWIEADAYEQDLPFLYEGQAIKATVDALPGRAFAGEVSLIYPELDAQTRTGRLRVTVENADFLLRPGMFATVQVETPMSDTEPFRSRAANARQTPPEADDATLIALQEVCPVTGLTLGAMGDPLKVSLDGKDVFVCCRDCEPKLREHPADYLAKLAPPPDNTVLTIPEGAVIDTGTQKIVYVEREPGVFEGVEVKLGPRTDNYYPVVSGLRPGDRVAAAGSFLLDAETRLNPAAASAYFGANGNGGEVSPRGASRAPPSEPREIEGEEPTAAHVKQLDKLSPADREVALAQRFCVVTNLPLGAMGVPVKFIVGGQLVFGCCQSCEAEFLKRPDELLKKLDTTAVQQPPSIDPPSKAHRH
jgi:Cu(I)/Ag(I) efflux system membrane fusion protein